MSNAPNQLWVRDVASGTRTKVYSYHHVDVGVVWSTDGRWLAVTDYDYTSVSNVARCVLLDPEGGVPADLSKAISRFDATTNRHMSGNKDVQCHVFGWIRGTSRVALTITGQGRADPFGFRQDFFYTPAARRGATRSSIPAAADGPTRKAMCRGEPESRIFASEE